MLGAQRLQALELGLLAEDRLGDGARQRVAVELEGVGHRFVEADAPRDGVGEDGEAARDQRGIGAIGLHGLDQRAAAGRQRDAFAADFVDAPRGRGP